jgi:hypothetical protein
VRQTKANSNPLDPALIARRAKKHLDELEVIVRQGTGELRSGTDPPRRSPTTRRSTSSPTRLTAQLKAQDVVDGEPPARP